VRTSRLAIASVTLALAFGVSACENSDPVEPVVPGETETDGSVAPDADPDSDQPAEAEAVIDVISNSGSVAPPHDSQERVVINPDLTATYSAGSRYDEDNPFYAGDFEITQEEYDEVLAAWDGLGIDEQAESDNSYSSGGVGGAYAIVTVTGGPYDVSAFGEMPAFMAFMNDALDLVPSEQRSEGQDIIDQYNDGDFGDDGSSAPRADDPGAGSDDGSGDEDVSEPGTGAPGVES
jgi:hypothetical protein